VRWSSAYDWPPKTSDDCSDDMVCVYCGQREVVGAFITAQQVARAQSAAGSARAI
jgi:hypothetical protein